MDTMDEFEEFKAMAYNNNNNNRRGSQSMPCTPHFPKRHIFNRESSKSERRRNSTKKRKEHSLTSSNTPRLSNGLSASHLDENTNTRETMDNELTSRLSKMTMVEIWQKRQRLQRQQSLGDPDYIPSPHDERSPPAAHPALGVRHSDSDKTIPTYGQFTAKHGRSFSCRDRTRSKRVKEIDVEAMRPRTSSVPSRGHIRRPDTLALKNKMGEISPREETTEFYLVRTFSTSKRGLINRGDSFKRRKTPIAANGYVNGPEDGGNESLRAGENLSHASSACSLESSGEPPIHRVLMLGSHGVGKSSLLQQFTSSDYMANLQRDSFQEPEICETKLVSILLDGEESTVYIATSTKLEVQGSLQSPDAYVVVYSVSDQRTFEQAVDMLHVMRQDDHCCATPVILVANKGDIVRNREVLQSDGKTAAVHYNCKYIEVSAVLNLKVDELLAGVVKQIRLTNRRQNSKRRRMKKCIPDESAGNSGCIEFAARGIVGKIFKKSSPMFRSCDNLLVL